MSIEDNSDEQIVDVAEVAETTDESIVVDDETGEAVEVDSLAAAAQSAGVIDEDTPEKTEFSDEAIETEAAAEIADVDESAVTKDLFGETVEEQVAESEEIELVTSICTDDGVEVTVESVIEAILFASDEPITSNRLVGIVETGSVKQVKDCVKSLNEKYKENNAAFRIEQIGGGFQMMTIDAYNHWLRKMIRVRADNKLTQAALETLAIVAYKQPIMRADVEGIRGVSSGEMIRSLMYKGLVKITGRAEVLGRPMLYGTTKKFLDVFGLNTAKDLPKIDELKKPQE